MILDKLNTYEAKFYDENKEAIAMLKSMFEGVIHDINVIYEACYKVKKEGYISYEKFIMELKDDLTPNILKEFLSMDIYQLEHFMGNLNSRLSKAITYVNVYGTPKYGDLARDRDDIFNSLQHSLVFGDKDEVGFDIDSNLAVFIYDRAYDAFPKEKSDEILYREEVDTFAALDVNAAFVRLMSSKDKFGLEWESFRTEIRRAIFSKIIAYGFSMRAVIHLLKNKFEDKTIYNDADLYRLLELSLARWAYATVNNLTTYQEYGVDINTLIDYIKAHCNTDIPTRGVMDLTNLGMAKLRGKEYMMRRSIDKYIDYRKETYQNDYVIVHQNPYASNIPMKTHRRIRMYNHNPSDSYKTCFPEKIISAYESWNGYKEKSATFNFYGIETYLKPTDPKFAEFRRKERQDIMAKLTSNERKRYTDLENDFILLKTEVVNASTQEAQRILVKRCAMLRDVINLELDRTNNEYLATLFLALDTDVFAMQSDLSDRNIFKERNTRLYGQLKSNNKWDY